MTMRTVYSHLDLPHSLRFLESFRRPFPARFLWQTTIDLDTGIHMSFDPSRISHWRTTLADEQLDRVYSNSTITEFMERFGYER